MYIRIMFTYNRCHVRYDGCWVSNLTHRPLLRLSYTSPSPHITPLTSPTQLPILIFALITSLTPYVGQHCKLVTSGIVAVTAS